MGKGGIPFKLGVEAQLMMKRLSQIGIFWLLALAGLVTAGWGEGAVSAEDWQRAWEDVTVGEELPEAEQLVEQTRLLKEALAAEFPLSAELWTLASGVLERWEASPDIGLARDAYLSLLTGLCGSQEGSEAPLPEEAALRIFLQRGLSLAESPQEEGALLLYLAESWIRSAPSSPSRLRRAESLLQQAATVLGTERPLDTVHVRLGQLYEELGNQADLRETDSPEATYFTRAASQYETALRLPFTRERLRERAELALVELRKPELEIRVAHRFLPNNEIHLTVRSRNIESVEARLMALPAGEGSVAHSLGQLREALAVQDPPAEQIRFLEDFALRGRYPHDWRAHEIRLDSILVGGWYGVRIRGGGITADDVILVTPLEVAAFPRQDGSLLLWVADGETGQSVANASITVLGEDGTPLVTTLTGINGAVSLEADPIRNWAEVCVLSDPNPGHLRRADLPGADVKLPWVVSNPQEVPPGGTIQWAILGLETGLAGLFDPGPVFMLPDGTQVTGEIAADGPDWIAGSLAIPDSLSEGGPVHIQLPQGIRLFVGHVRFRKPYPLDLELSGEQLASSLNLFLASSPVGVRFTPALGAQSELPAFIRLRVLALSRDPAVFSAAAPLQVPPQLIHEKILPFDADSRMETVVELPDLSSNDMIRPLKIEVLPLDDSTPLGVAWFGMIPFRRLVELQMEDQIVRPDEPAVLSFYQKSIDESDRRPTEGELIVYRETWQNRYIHRRRGTTLSESEFRALPDRSLLGAAKTDYRLVEEGFIREELRRIPLEVNEQEEQLSIALDQPGHYKIEFAGREVDTRAHYPEGPLEIWVVAESSDLRAFRSDHPRLILEDQGDGLLRVLILLDRTDPAVLFDLETADGNTVSKVSKPDHAALYFEFEQPVNSGVSTARALIVGDRRSDFLWETSVPRLRGDWDLSADNLFGMNPGVGFKWDLSAAGAPPVEPVLWTFYANSANLLSPARLRWQSELQRSTRHHPESGAVFLSQWLPFSLPFVRAEARRGSRDPSLVGSLIDPELFISLFPETHRFPPAASSADPFLPVVELPEAGRYGITGNFPSSAGRWDLTVLSSAGHHQLKVESWLVSTELPIRTTIQGPELLRVGDRALLPLTIENTTVEPASLKLMLPESRIAESAAREMASINLAAGQSAQTPLTLDAVNPGTDTLDVRVEGAGSSSDAVHTLKVTGPSTRAAFAFFLARPEGTTVTDSLDLGNWAQANLLVVPGLGALLPEIWPSIREAQDSADPLLSALGEWGLQRVLAHHGIDSSGEPATAEADLTTALLERQVATGGWGWLPGGEADPWMSAFVIWTLEIFAGADWTIFPEMREQGQRFLEQVLIDDSVDDESQLFALRALAMPAFHSDAARPSRIQARTFLDYLHRQTELPDASVAILLQVAKAYGFKEEVRLLTELLLQREADKRRFWPASLVYLALDEHPGQTGRDGFGRLLEALKALERRGPARSWEQVGGFLNLLAAYYWKGDFFADGEVSVSVQDEPPLRLSLNPDIRAPRLLKIGLKMDSLESGKIPFTLDMDSAFSPVLVAAIGLTNDKADLPPMESVESRFHREFFETTLLKGSRSRSVELGDDLPGLQIGDILRMSVVFNLAEPLNFARFEFPVPAGMRLASEAIIYSVEAPPEPVAPELSNLQAIRESTDRQMQILSIGPLHAGRHSFILSYNVDWAGSYNWPGARMLVPETGAIYQLTADRQVTIVLEPD